MPQLIVRHPTDIWGRCERANCKRLAIYEARLGEDSAWICYKHIDEVESDGYFDIADYDQPTSEGDSQ